MTQRAAPDKPQVQYVIARTQPVLVPALGSRPSRDYTRQFSQGIRAQLH